VWFVAERTSTGQLLGGVASHAGQTVQALQAWEAARAGRRSRAGGKRSSLATLAPLPDANYMEDMATRRTTIILSEEEDRLLRETSKREGVSQSELIRRGIRAVTSGYVRRPRHRTGWLKLILDTGGWLMALAGRAPWSEAMEDARRLIVPGLVLAEVDYHLRHRRRETWRILDEVASGEYAYEPPTRADLQRAIEIDRKFASVSLNSGSGSARARTRGRKPAGLGEP
jgi:hypothetical protein